MSDLPEVNADVASATALGIGAILQSAREEKKLSIEDVSNRLRLSVRQIRALEGEDFSALPEPTITRGFLRNYARLLEIDAAPLLEIYKSHVSNNTGAAITLQSENILISSVRKPFWAKYIVASGVIVLGLIIWMVYMDYFHESSPPKPEVDIAHEHDVTLPEPVIGTDPLPEIALPAAEREGDDAGNANGAITGNDTTVETPKPAAAIDAPTPSIPGVLPIEKPSTPAVSAPVEVVQSVAVSNVSDGQKNVLRLRLSVADTTWVSVTDPTDREIVNRTIPAGGVQRVESLPPLKLVIGNAEGVKLTVNDKSFDLTPYIKLNVARVTLE